MNFNPSEYVVGAGGPDLVAEMPAPRQGESMADKGEWAWWPAPGTSFEDARFYGGRPAGGYWNYSAVWACTRAIAETLSSLPGVLYEQTGARERQPSDDPLAELLRQPNPYMDQMTFFDLQTCRLVNRGNAYQVIERDGRDDPLYLWPVENDKVQAWQNSDGTIDYHIYKNPRDLLDGFGGGYEVIDSRDMINIVGPNSYNGVTAPGVVPRASADIEHGLKTRRYGSQFFGSGGKPAGVLEHPGHLSPDDRRQMRLEWNQVHAPTYGGKEHQIAVLWENMKYKEIAVAPEQAQFLESTRLNGQVIAQWYGVSPAIIQDYSDSKFATIEAQLKHFVMLSLRPWAVRWETGLKNQLLGAESSLHWEWVFSALLRGDTKTQSEASEIKFRNGVMNADEWRGSENLNPIADGSGSTYWINNAYSPVQERRAQAAAAVTGGGEQFAQRVLNQALRSKQRNEQSRALKAIDRGPEFLRQWMNDYYPEFVGKLSEALAPAAAELGLEPDQLAADYCEQSVGLLNKALLDGNGQYNPAALTDVVLRFEEREIG